MKSTQKNAKIYSRTRINLPAIFIYSPNNSDNNKIKGILKVLTIAVISIITAALIMRGINPIIEQLCVDEAKNIATRISNEEATEVMKKYTYEDLVTITKDNNGNITLIQANTATINSITSDIPIRIIDKLKNNSNSNIYIHLGSIFGFKIFSGVGPKITAKIANTGNTETTLKSEFTAQGINQTLHCVYLEISLDVNILTPYKVINSRIVNQVLIAESIIVGNVPSSYYNLNTSNSNDAIRAIDK